MAAVVVLCEAAILETVSPAFTVYVVLAALFDGALTGGVTGFDGAGAGFAGAAGVEAADWLTVRRCPTKMSPLLEILFKLESLATVVLYFLANAHRVSPALTTWELVAADVLAAGFDGVLVAGLFGVLGAGFAALPDETGEGIVRR